MDGIFEQIQTDQKILALNNLFFQFDAYVLPFLHITFQNTKQPYLQKISKSTILL